MQEKQQLGWLWMSSGSRQGIGSWQRAYDRYMQWIGQIQGGAEIDSGARDEYIRFMKSESSQFAKDLLHAGLDYYNQAFKEKQSRLRE